MRFKIIVTSSIVFSILSISIQSNAQRQLLLISGDKVVHYFKRGDALRTKWRDSKVEHWGLIVEVNEFQVITSQDTFDIAKVRKVLVPGRPMVNKIGKLLMIGGTLFFVIDQFNWTIVQGNDPSMDDSVWKPASILVGIGAPMLFFKKDWRKIKGGLRLKSVGTDSRLYIPE